MERGEWKISCAVEDVRKGCAERLAFRRERLAYWRDQKEAKLAEVRERGITIKETFDQFGGGTMTYAGNGPGAGHQVGVSIDADLHRAITEAQGKINEHERALREYERWAAFLDRATGHFDVAFADFEFFFGAA